MSGTLAKSEPMIPILVALPPGAVADSLIHSLTERGGSCLFVSSWDEHLLGLCARLQPCVVVTDEDAFSSDAGLVESTLGLNDVRIVVVKRTDVAGNSFEELRLGCWGVVQEAAGILQILSAIERVCRGEYWLSRRRQANLCRILLAELRLGLTSRERDIWSRIARGDSNLRISEALCISEETVHWHIRGLYRKLSTSDRQRAIEIWHKGC